MAAKSRGEPWRFRVVARLSMPCFHDPKRQGSRVPLIHHFGHGARGVASHTPSETRCLAAGLQASPASSAAGAARSAVRLTDSGYAF